MMRTHPADRVTGEWFQATPELMEFIKSGGRNADS